MHYQLFIPGGKAQDPQMLIDRGLADMVAGAEFMPNQQGPTGNEFGAVIAWRKPGSTGFGYQPDKQTWIPSVANGPDGEGKGRYWVGFWNDSPVTPEDLLRPYSHRGQTVELGDGNNWRLPVLEELPRDAILADDGSWKFELQRKYHDLAQDANDILRSTIEGKEQDYGYLVEFGVRCLNQNYRLLREVASYLGLFTTQNVETVVATMLSLEIKS